MKRRSAICSAVSDSESTKVSASRTRSAFSSSIVLATAFARIALPVPEAPELPLNDRRASGFHPARCETALESWLWLEDDAFGEARRRSGRRASSEGGFLFRRWPGGARSTGFGAASRRTAGYWLTFAARRA